MAITTLGVILTPKQEAQQARWLRQGKLRLTYRYTEVLTTEHHRILFDTVKQEYIHEVINPRAVQLQLPLD